MATSSLTTSRLQDDAQSKTSTLLEELTGYRVVSKKSTPLKAE
jgi:hypothetical protein